MRIPAAALAALSPLLASGAALAQMTRFEALSNPVVDQPTGEARRFTLADIDEDGLTDAILGYEATAFGVTQSRVEVHRGSVSGSFFQAARVELGSVLDLGAAAAGNFDGAAGRDVAVIAGATGEVLVLHDFAIRPPRFTVRSTIGTSHTPVDLAAADLDGDGVDEIVVLEREVDGERAQVSYHSGPALKGGKIALPRGSQPSRLAAGDLDGDGFPEIVIAGQSADHALVVLTNTTSPGDRKADFDVTSYAGAPATGLALGGFDADDPRLDVAVVTAAGDLLARLNQGDGTLGDELVVPSLGGYAALGAGDLNGDGSASEDLLGFHAPGATLDVYTNVDALGRFTLDGTVAAVPDSFADLLVDDYNLDGAGDFLLLTSGAAGVVLRAYPNVTPYAWDAVLSAREEAVVAEWEAINAGTASTCTDFFTGIFDEHPELRDQVRAEAAALPLYSLGGGGAIFVGGTLCGGGSCIYTETHIDPVTLDVLFTLVECD